ncbi:glycosyltransferase family 4 protein [Streptomyces caeni]|uniref:Glycosyltransferase family 4 protein n=1 Tax=Streptomyces caeni TaxID=2307231 RepID=A0ABW4INE9_9ACTN
MRPLRIALVHSFYSAPGGENEAPLDHAAALRRAGHEVRMVDVHTDELRRSPLYSMRCAVTVASGRGRSPVPELHAFAPDVVHVHNLFPNFGRAWAADWPGPLVTTLHNFRPLCAAATLYRDGAVCTRCPDGDRWAGLRSGCYRGSRVATLPLAWAGRHGPGADPLLRRADRVVVLSELSRTTYAAAGVDERRMALIPNFVPPVDGGPPAEPGERWVYVGKLTVEKGIRELLRHWPADEPLDVIGSGPLEDACRAVAPRSVVFHGVLGRAELRKRLPGYRGLVFPSRWYEGMPLVYIEALAAGLPVLAFEGSAAHVAVRAEGTGAVTCWDDPLPRVLREAGSRFPALRAHCRRVYEEAYSEEVWTSRMVRLYAELCGTSTEMEPA